MNWNDEIVLLRVPLPEDVLKHKWHGDFAAAQRVIDRRLSRDIPEVMQKRLLLEKKLLMRIPEYYIYTREEACTILKETIRDFQPQELDALLDEDYVDWFYINGELRIRDNFLENLLKTRPDYEARQIHEGSADGDVAANGRSCEAQRTRDDRSADVNVATDEGKGESLSKAAFLQKTCSLMRREGGIRHTIRLRARLWLRDDAGVQPGETVRAYLPVPAVDAQVKRVQILDDGTAAIPEGCLRFVHIAEEHAPQRTICWEVNWQPGIEFAVEYEYEIAAGYIDLWGASVNVPALETWKTQYACFDPVMPDDLAEQEPHIIFSPLICSLTAEVVGEETRPLEKARRIYNYITTKAHYSFMRSYATIPSISEYIAAGQKGDCGVQALLFITMCRQAGIPARWQSGLYAQPGDVGCHDWARFYIEEYGWLFADCSFGGSGYRHGDESKRRFYFGNLDPWRMPSCRRFQTNFDPPMEKLRSDPYDAQSGEVELPDKELHDRHPFESETVMISCV